MLHPICLSTGNDESSRLFVVFIESNSKLGPPMSLVSLVVKTFLQILITGWQFLNDSSLFAGFTSHHAFLINFMQDCLNLLYLTGHHFGINPLIIEQSFGNKLHFSWHPLFYFAVLWFPQRLHHLKHSTHYKVSHVDCLELTFYTWN